MPKTASGTDVTVADGNYTALATLARIVRRDKKVFRLASHDRDVLFNGELYLASSGLEPTAVENREGTKVDEFEITAIFDNNVVDVEEISRGLFNYANVTLYTVFWPDPAKYSLVLERGRFGRVARASTGAFRFDVRSITERLQADLGRVMMPKCPFDLGDFEQNLGGCRVPAFPKDVVRSIAYVLGDFIKVRTLSAGDFSDYENRIYECVVAGTTSGSAPTFDTTVGNTTVDGGVTWEAFEAWTRHGVIATVTDRQTFALTVTEPRAIDGWFNLGSIFFETGNNALTGVEVKGWTSVGSLLTLALELPLTVQVGDKIRITPGCNKSRILHCVEKFAMPGTQRYSDGFARWHGGFDGIPGRAYLLQDVSKTSEENRTVKDASSAPWLT